MKSMAKRLGGGANSMQFGKSNAKVYVEAQTGKTFADVAGQDEAKEALTEIVDFLHNPKKYEEIGAKAPTAPGTGSATTWAAPQSSVLRKAWTPTSPMPAPCMTTWNRLCTRSNPPCAT